MMSLRWRIMASMVLVILLTAVVTVVVGYCTSKSRLGAFVDGIGDDRAVRLARNLSREYTTAGGWQTVERTLSEAGYVYETELLRERSEEHEDESFELFHRDPIRVVIVGVDGRVVTDNAAELSPDDATSELAGHRETVFDLATNQPVGHVYVDVNHDFLSRESHGFLNALLYITGIGGLLTVGIGVLLAAWLSKRITGPVAALTKATQAISRGDTTHLPVTSSDELGQMSAAFNRMASSLATQRDLRKRLVDDVSHELNTPLSVIQLEARGLRDGLQTPEGASDQIVREVDRLRGLVTDLNSLAETDYGELRLALEASSVFELLTAETDRWRPQAQSRQIELAQEFAVNLPDIHLDRMRMSHAVGNVLGNAIQYTEAGGSVVVRAALKDGEAVEVSIIDDGIGIHADDLPHVFDRFYRSRRSGEGGTAGTGLGLAIARAIVEAHEGTIAVASDGPGQGAAVTIRLPTKTRESSSSP